MPNSSKRFYLAAACVAVATAIGAVSSARAAEAYPSHPLKFVVNFPPGGASDTMARLFGQKLSEAIGQPVVVDNRPGAGGAIGMVYVAQQPADGYTFTLGTLSPIVTQPLIAKVPYDVARQFMPVSLIATGPSVLVVNARSPYRSVADIVAAARAAPGKLNFGSGGTGNFAQFMGEMFNMAGGIRTTHIPYKGGSQALNDVLAGQLDMITVDVPTAIPQIKAGLLRPIAFTGTERSPLLPGVPTFTESGYPGVVGTNWWAIYLPAGVPAPVFASFQKALVKAMEDPALVAKYAELGARAQHGSPEELRRFIAAETERYDRIVKAANIRAD